MNGLDVQYTYWIDGDILAIEDWQGLHSVTAHVEQVLAQIEQKEGSLAAKFVVYADSQGIWDAITQLGQSLVIRPLGGNSNAEACQLLNQRIAEQGPARYRIDDYRFDR